MAHSELGRLTSIQRTAKLIGALLSGRELTRADVTGLLGVRVAAADRQLEAIGRHIPLVREKRRGRLHVRIDRSKVAGGAERIPIATTIAACVGASLGRLFEGTNYEKGMHDLVQYVSRDAIHPERFQDSRRQFVFLVRGGEKALPEKEELLEEGVDALQRRRGLQIRYRAFDGARQSLRIEPLSLAVYDHQLYVIGRSRGRPGPRAPQGPALPRDRQLDPRLRLGRARHRAGIAGAPHRGPRARDGEGARPREHEEA